MTDVESPFLLSSEVTAISRMGDVTRGRLERDKRFPERIKIGLRKVAYRRCEIEDWARDPAAWVAKQEAQP